MYSEGNFDKVINLDTHDLLAPLERRSIQYCWLITNSPILLNKLCYISEFYLIGLLR